MGGGVNVLLLKILLNFCSSQIKARTHSDDGVMVGEGLCGVDRPQVCCCGSSLSCNRVFVCHSSCGPKHTTSSGINSAADLRSLLMTGMWLLWSFRYSARKPSRDTRMRGGLEKLQKVLPQEEKQKIK